MTSTNSRLEDKIKELAESFDGIIGKAQTRIHGIRGVKAITESASKANLTAQDVMPIFEEIISTQRAYFDALQKIALELSRQLDIQLGISTAGADSPMDKHELLEFIQKQIDWANQQNFL